MSEATEIDTRVTRLENEMAEVRYLAKRADRDVSNLRATLNGHTGVLNAIGETQREHGLQLADHGRRLDRLEHKVDNGFHQANQNFEAIGRRLETVQAGMVKITALLDRAVGEGDEG